MFPICVFCFQSHKDVSNVFFFVSNLIFMFPIYFYVSNLHITHLSPNQDLLQTSQRCLQDHISVTNIQQWSPTFSQIQVTVLVTVMVTDSVCWSQSHLVGDFFNVKNRKNLKSLTNMARLSSTQTCHQRKRLSTSVTNKDVVDPNPK